MINPKLKRDLMLVKEAFERKALEQSTMQATLVPMVDTVANVKTIHRIIRDRMFRFPAVFYKHKKLRDTVKDHGPSLQEECIPCLNRITALADLDLSASDFAMLDVYNNRIISNMISMFRSMVSYNPIQADLCAAYDALKAHCVPDIKRLIAILTFLISDIRRIEFKIAGDQLLSLVGTIMANAMVGATVNLGMFGQLIADTVRCVVNDINFQLSKVEPILTKEGIKDTSDAIKTAWVEKQPSVYPRNYGLRIPPVPDNIFSALGQGINSKISLGKGLQVAAPRMIADMCDVAVGKVNGKIESIQNELFKLLKLSDQSVTSQIGMLDQVHLIFSVLDVLTTILQSQGDYDPCGETAAQRFMNKVKVPGTKIVSRPPQGPDEYDPDELSIEIIPEEIEIPNPVVEEILANNGISVEDVDPDKRIKEKITTVAGKIVSQIPIEVRLSECLHGSKNE